MLIPILTFNTGVVELRFLGLAETYTKEGYLLIKPHVKNVLRYIGAVVHNSTGRNIGVIVDIIGRVEDPRLVVRLEHRDLGEILATRKERIYYTFPRKPRRAR